MSASSRPSDLGTVLLTGGTGQIGQSLRSLLRDRAARIMLLSGEERRDAPHPTEKWVHWPYDESSSPPAIDEPVDAVVHLGAQTSAYAARSDPKRDLETNVVRFVSLLQRVSGNGQRPFVVLAGSATQAGYGASLVNSSTPESPETFYDVAKAVSAMYLEQFVREGFVSGITLRFSNVYGGSPRLLADRGLISAAMRHALRGEPLTLFRGVDGKRDFLHVRDAANACVLALSCRRAFSQDRFWVGSGRSLRLSEALSVISETAAALSGNRSKVEVVDPPPDLYPIEGRSVILDSSAFQEEAGWRPQVSFEHGVRELGRTMFEEMTTQT